MGLYEEEQKLEVVGTRSYRRIVQQGHTRMGTYAGTVGGFDGVPNGGLLAEETSPSAQSTNSFCRFQTSLSRPAAPIVLSLYVNMFRLSTRLFN